MSKETHSKIVLNQQSVNTLIAWILKQNKQEVFRTLKVSHEEDHLHLKFAGMNYDNVHGGIDIPFIGNTLVIALETAFGNAPECDLYISLRGNHLKGRVELHGLLAASVQNIPGIDSIIFLFAPHLKKVGGFRIHGPFDFDFDLSSLHIPDGDGGDSELTDIVKFHSVAVGDKNEEMLIAEFSIK